MAHVFTDSKFDQDVLKSNQPVMVDFWAEWCQPCRAVTPVIEELAKDYEGKVKVGKMNVDENGETAMSFSIMSIPTVMVFKNGQPVKTLVGVQSKDTYRKALEEAIAA